MYDVDTRTWLLRESHALKILNKLPERSCPSSTFDLAQPRGSMHGAVHCWRSCWRALKDRWRRSIGVPTGFVCLRLRRRPCPRWPRRPCAPKVARPMRRGCASRRPYTMWLSQAAFACRRTECCPLDPLAAEALAQDFNRVWTDSGFRLIAGRAGALYCSFDRMLSAFTHDPADALGRHIEAFLPSGSDAPRLRLLMSEVEMWLFEHAVNRARQAQGSAVITGLWLWGDGAPVKSLPEIRRLGRGRRSILQCARRGPCNRCQRGQRCGRCDAGTGERWLATRRTGVARNRCCAIAFRPARAAGVIGRQALLHREQSGGARVLAAARPWWESFA